MNRCDIWTDEEINLLKKEYGNKTIQDIHIVGRSYNAKRSRAKILGLKSKLKGQGKRLYSCNEDYFAQLNNENCYWAGFIAADGCIQKHKLTFCLSEKDEKHLLKFKNAIKHTGPIRRHDKMVYLEISSQQIVHDLLTHFNITERKSLTLKRPNINKFDLCLSFIAGLIDGDGYIGVYHNRQYPMPMISVTGTCDMLNWICQFFNDRLFVIPGKAKPNQRNNVWIYSIYNHFATLVEHYVNRLNLPLLERKWNLL